MDALTRMFGTAVRDTFMGLPVWDGGPAPVVLLGADGCTPYASVGSYCAGGPRAIREASAPFDVSRMNFDTGRPLAVPLPADMGDLPIGDDAVANRATIREAVSRVLAAGAVPLLLGGDDSVPIPMLQALENQGPLTILQIDAHIDWRDEVDGERWGLSSIMRRASEMLHVERIVQVGQRGMGSARPEDAADARAWGATLISAYSSDPVTDALAAIPAGTRVAICLDWDALDPTLMPAVIARTAGGLTYAQVLRLVSGAAARTQVVAMNAVEFMPTRDMGGLGATHAAQLVAPSLSLIRPR